MGNSLGRAAGGFAAAGYCSKYRGSCRGSQVCRLVADSHPARAKRAGCIRGPMHVSRSLPEAKRPKAGPGATLWTWASSMRHPAIKNQRLPTDSLLIIYEYWRVNMIRVGKIRWCKSLFILMHRMIVLVLVMHLLHILLFPSCNCGINHAKYHGYMGED